MRIIMLTAKGRETEVSKGIALGADAYVTKPFSTKDLMADISRLLGDADSVSCDSSASSSWRSSC